MSGSELLNDRPNSSDNPAGTQPAQHQSARVISLDQVTKHFGRFAALRGVTADFASGQLYTVLGDNGAGKSTLLRIVAGLLQPTRGKVEVLGTNDLGSIRPQLGYMAHAPLLYDELDAMENLIYFAGLYGITNGRRDAAQRANQVCQRTISMVGLDPMLKRRVGAYSQGMRQRLSLARAVLHDPKILLLDEPFSNVDITSAREMVRLLGHMRDRGKTIFLVTHQPSLLEGTADEFVHMSLGRIVGRSATAALDVGDAARTFPSGEETPGRRPGATQTVPGAMPAYTEVRR